MSTVVKDLATGQLAADKDTEKAGGRLEGLVVERTGIQGCQKLPKKPRLTSSQIANASSNHDSGKDKNATQDHSEETDNAVLEMEEGDGMTQAEALTEVGARTSSHRN